MNSSDPLVNKAKVENAQKEVQSAGQEFTEQQRGFKKSIAGIHEQIALYSSGIISLSITFLGYLLSSDKGVTAIQTARIIVPVYWILYVSWLLLTLSIVLMLLIKWFDALYLFFNSQHNYHQKRKELQEALIPYYQTYPNIIFEAGSNLDSEIRVANTNIETLKNELIPKTFKKANDYYTWFDRLQKASIASFISAIVLLLLFAVAVTRLVILQKLT